MALTGCLIAGGAFHFSQTTLFLIAVFVSFVSANKSLPVVCVWFSDLVSRTLQQSFNDAVRLHCVLVRFFGLPFCFSEGR